MYLGLDFGTSSVKGVLIDGKQKIIATASSPLKVSRPHSGWSEQNPEDWWKAAGKVVAALRKAKPKAVAAVEGIGLSGQQHGATLLDKDGKVLRPCILWNDARSFVECQDIMTREPRAVGLAGNIPLAGYTAPKLVWVKKHEPRIFEKVAKVLLPKDYIRFRMTGTYGSDMSDSSGTFWLDIAKRKWSDMLLAASDMRRDQMPELFEGTDDTGRLTAAVAKAWPKLRRLYFNSHKFTDGACPGLTAFADLDLLDLKYCIITDAGLTSLSVCKKLRSIWMPDAKITEAALDTLAKMKSLKELKLPKPGNGLTAEGIAKFKKQRPDVKLN